MVKARIVVMWQHEVGYVPQRLCVPGGDLFSTRDPVRQVAQLDIQESSLEVVQQTGKAMTVIFTGLSILAVISHSRNKQCHFRIVGSDCATIAVSAENFERIEAPTTR